MYIYTIQQESEINPREAAKCAMMPELWTPIISTINVLLFCFGGID